MSHRIRVVQYGLGPIDSAVATMTIAVNAVRRVVEAAPGLVTMRDLPVVTVW